MARGVYTTLRGTTYPQLYYLPDGGGTTLRSAMLSRALPDHVKVPSLQPGDYTLIAHPHSPAQLYRGSRRLDDVRNPENIDLTVNFVVPEQASPADMEVVVRAPRRYHLWPRVRVYRREDDRDPTVGADVGYIAGVEIWRVEPDGRWWPLYPLALPYAFLRYAWTVTRIERAADGGVQRRVVVATSEGRRAFFTHTFGGPGEYEVSCSVDLRYDDASPAAVADHRVDRVRRLEETMAIDLAVLQGRDAKGPAIWATSSVALLAAARDQLRAAEAASPRNEALVDSLREAVAKLEHQLVVRTSEGPFPIKAIFADRRTGRSRPISLFVGPALPGDQESGTQTWLLIDLTFPAFYRTYTGHGLTVAEALRSAFEAARTSFRGEYPPGRILARIEWPGTAASGVAPFDLSTDTESWERTAYEWLSLDASALGVIGLAAALVFPPTSAVVGAIVVAGAVAGATVAVINIAERINNNAFEWDRHLALDLLSIATAFASVAGVAARGAVSGIGRAIAAGEPVTIGAVSRLRQLVGFQRAVLYMDIGTALGSGVLIAQDVYLELREVEAALGPEALPEFRRLYGDEEGRRRWEQERLTLILGVLARAAVSGTLTAVSIRASRHGLADAAQQYAAWHIPGADLPPSTRLAVVTGPAPPAFPAAAMADPAPFRRAQVDGVVARLGLHGDPAALAVAERLSPQAAWGINTAIDSLTDRQRALLMQVLRPGGADLPELRRFLRDGGNLAEVAGMLENQPGLVRNGIGSFATAERRAAEFRELVATVPDPSTFHWQQENLEQHFWWHVLGKAHYPE